MTQKEAYLAAMNIVQQWQKDSAGLSVEQMHLNLAVMIGAEFTSRDHHSYEKGYDAGWDAMDRAYINGEVEDAPGIAERELLIKLMEVAPMRTFASEHYVAELDNGELTISDKLIEQM